MDFIKGFVEIKPFPVLDVAHNLLAAQDVRFFLGEEFIKKHPFACWMVTILSIFSGSLMSNFLLGSSILTPLANTQLMLTATGVWCFVFYAPFDIGRQLGVIFPVNLIANILKEVYRAKKIRNGILQAASIHPRSWLVMIIIGTLRGNCTGVIKQFWQLIQKIRAEKDSEPIEASISTISCIVAAFIFACYETNSIIVPYEVLHLAVVLVFVCCKISSIFLSSRKAATNCDMKECEKLKEKKDK